jgi:pimeloyl-[acyl-carrier protein] synthase
MLGLTRPEIPSDEQPLDFNPFLPEVHDDPYPFYRQLRERDPVHPSLPGLWLLTRYSDTSALLRDHHRFSNDSRNSDLVRMFMQMMGDRQPGLLEESTARSMLFVDPPDHTRLRNLVSKAFTARVIEAMRPHVQEVVDELIGAFREAAVVDLVSELAYPLPIRVICEMLGIPPEDHDRFREWSAELVLTLDPMITLEIIERGNRAAEAFAEYFAELLAARRAHPRDDLLSALIAAEDRGQTLTEEELLSTCILLLVAGHETTVNLISNGMLALLRNPDQVQRLRHDPGLIRSAVEELLRFDSPVQLVGRTAMQDVEIGGVRIARGHQVVGIIGAANRDPAQFAQPDRLDIGRPDNRHLAFSGGIHFCLGAPLARVEAQIAIGTLVRSFPGLRLADEAAIERRETVTLRGLRRLPVALT